MNLLFKCIHKTSYYQIYEPHPCDWYYSAPKLAFSLIFLPFPIVKKTPAFINGKLDLALYIVLLKMQGNVLKYLFQC